MFTVNSQISLTAVNNKVCVHGEYKAVIYNRPRATLLHLCAVTGSLHLHYSTLLTPSGH